MPHALPDAEPVTSTNAVSVKPEPYEHVMSPPPGRSYSNSDHVDAGTVSWTLQVPSRYSPSSELHLLYDPGVEVSELLWDEANEAHIARHEVSRQEVIQVVFGSKSIFALDDSRRRGRLVVFGVTNTARYLVVVLDEPTTTGTTYVVTARPMTTRERREYEEAVK